jgi:hypothetical protein
MNREKVLHIMKNIKKMCELFGNNIPENEMNLVNSIIEKLESNIEPKDFTDEEFSFMEKNYKAIYG